MQNTKLLLIFCCLVIVISLGFLYLGFNQPINKTAGATKATQGILVTEVIDGDTIEVEGGVMIRLLGVDTPETVDPRRSVGCFGKEASKKVSELLSNKRVILEKDISESDIYGRLLRFVYLPLDSSAHSNVLFVNDYLIREGYAKVLTIPPDVKFTEQFLEAQKQAREAKLGLWGSC